MGYIFINAEVLHDLRKNAKSSGAESPCAASAGKNVKVPANFLLSAGK
jgi:hypothetical protein